MKRLLDKFGFTLMEVNLAIFIMAVAILGMVALYPLGFRESQQARSDVVESVVADGILNPLVATLSTCSSNMTWQAWKSILGGSTIYPDNGWLAYCGDTRNLTPKSRTAVNGTTGGVIGKIAAASGQFNSVSDAQAIFSQCSGKGIACALVISYGELPTYGNGGGANGYYLPDYSRIVLCLRLSKRAAQLFEQPAFYAEVHFQGDPNEGGL
jgi:hypothetical protein